MIAAVPAMPAITPMPIAVPNSFKNSPDLFFITLTVILVEIEEQKITKIDCLITKNDQLITNNVNCSIFNQANFILLPKKLTEAKSKALHSFLLLKEITSMKKRYLIGLLGLTTALQSCIAVEGVFRAGFKMGIYSVFLIIGLIIWIIFKRSKRR